MLLRIRQPGAYACYLPWPSGYQAQYAINVHWKYLCSSASSTPKMYASIWSWAETPVSAWPLRFMEIRGLVDIYWSTISDILSSCSRTYVYYTYWMKCKYYANGLETSQHQKALLQTLINTQDFLIKMMDFMEIRKIHWFFSLTAFLFHFGMYVCFYSSLICV